MKDRNVELNWEKCKLRVTELEILGHKIGTHGISPSESKIATLRTFRQPQNEAEVRSFLGLANYMNKYIQNLATIDEPLRKLLHKDMKFEWTEDHSNAFREIKTALCRVENLGFYKVEDHTAVIADASPVGLGAILVQFDADGYHRVISFASKSLTETERRYCQTEKEALALVWSVERFQYYLLGKTFDLVTDCKVLELLFSKRSKPCARIERWVLRLQMFEYRVVYVAGKDNVADTLSRLAVREAKPFDVTEEIIIHEVSMYAAGSAALTWQEITESTNIDSEMQLVLETLETGHLQNLPVEYRVCANELSVYTNVLLRGDRIVVPFSLRRRVLATAHEGHPGITMMKNHLRSNVWWPKMDAELERYVKQCRGCTLVAAPEPPEPMRRSQLPSAPWQTIALDFLGPLPEGQHLLVVIDCYSRFMEVVEMEGTTVKGVIREISIMFSRYGMPTALKADNAPQLSSACTEFREFCVSNGIKLLNTIPYWPQSNGEVERQNRSILKRLRIAQELGQDWRAELRRYLLIYHSTKHPSTGKSPGELMFGRHIKSKLPTVINFDEDAGVRERDAVVKEKGKEYADKKRHAREHDLQEGDVVLAKRMRKTSKVDTDFSNEEFIVKRKTGTDTIIQSKESGKQYRRSSAHLKKVGNRETSDDNGNSGSTIAGNGSNDSQDKPSNKSTVETHHTHRTSLSKRVSNQPVRYQDYVTY